MLGSPCVSPFSPPNPRGSRFGPNAKDSIRKKPQRSGVQSCLSPTAASASFCLAADL